MRSCFSSSRPKVYNFYQSFIWQWGQYCKLISSIRPKGNTLSREYLVKEESLPIALARVELKCVIYTWGASVLEESMATGLGRVDLKCIISTSESLVMGESRASGLGRVELNLPIFPPENAE
jgi:hypothetical protein